MLHVVKNLPANAGDARDAGSIPRLGRCLRDEMASHSSITCMENYMDGGVWRATVHGVAKELDMTEHAHTQSKLSLETGQAD